VDGDGTFRHVGGENDLLLRARRHRAILLLRRLIPVERQQLPPVTVGQRRARGLRAPDFERSRQEYQHMARPPARRPPGLPPARRNAACTRSLADVAAPPIAEPAAAARPSRPDTARSAPRPA